MTSSKFVLTKLIGTAYVFNASYLQGVQTLSEKSKLLISPTNHWSVSEMLATFWPLHLHNLDGNTYELIFYMTDIYSTIFLENLVCQKIL